MSFQKVDKIVVAGLSDSGKTAWIKWMIRMAGWKNYVIWDANDEYEGFPNRYVPKTEGIEEFNNFMKRVWESQKNITKATVSELNSLMVIVDEAEQYMPDGWPKTDNYAAQIVRRGSHRGIGICACTRAIAELNKNLIRQSRHLVFFSHQGEINDLSYLTSLVGKENAIKISELDKYWWLLKSGGKCEVFEPIIP